MDMQRLIEALRNPDVRMRGASGGYQMDQGGQGETMMPMMPMQMMPTMVGGRVGIGGKNFDAGVSGNVMQGPNNRLMGRMGPVDVGYRAPMMGGVVGARLTRSPDGKYGGQLSYQKEF
jgi:hypothetical protein